MFIFKFSIKIYWNEIQTKQIISWHLLLFITGLLALVYKTFWQFHFFQEVDGCPEQTMWSTEVLPFLKWNYLCLVFIAFFFQSALKSTNISVAVFWSRKQNFTAPLKINYNKQMRKWHCFYKTIHCDQREASQVKPLGVSKLCKT